MKIGRGRFLACDFTIFHPAAFYNALNVIYFYCRCCRNKQRGYTEKVAGSRTGTDFCVCTNASQFSSVCLHLEPLKIM